MLPCFLVVSGVLTSDKSYFTKGTPDCQPFFKISLHFLFFKKNLKKQVYFLENQSVSSGSNLDWLNFWPEYSPEYPLSK